MSIDFLYAALAIGFVLTFSAFMVAIARMVELHHRRRHIARRARARRGFVRIPPYDQHWQP